MKNNCILFLLCICVGCAPEQNETLTSPGSFGADRKMGERGYLSQYIGTYHYERVLNDEQMSDVLAELMGDAVTHLRRNMLVKSPIGMDGGYLVLRGLAAHKGGEEEALALVDMYNNKLHVVIYSKPQLYLYSDAAKWHHLPNAIRDYIYLAHHGFPNRYSDGKMKHLHWNSYP
jgi:hypothetical protein